MCETSGYWHEPTNTRLLSVVLMAIGISADLPVLRWYKGQVIKLWEGAYTFSYHYGKVEGEGFIHHNSTLQHYWSEQLAREAMDNFVRSLNAHWEE